jgi:release factor glutamine methyltransferase
MQSGSSYRPMMSPKRALRIRAWHDAALSESNREEAVELNYLGTSLVVPPGVFVPTPVSPLLGKAVLAEVKRGDRVLDLGTGSGVNATLPHQKPATLLR